ncbi:hypothetical protein AB0D46_14100 [Streptomyces sp. NPDC048383]|uniref:hypothetical protein n=1 Tax=Streptomyces sp. NPDC048383 TaxID=3155386 RepID=UPI00341A8047
MSRTTPATRSPVRFARQRLLGRDLHFRLTRTGLDTAPPDRRPMLQSLDGERVTWPDGTAETLDAIILATGYRPDLPHLATLDGVLDAEDRPVHRGGRSSRHPDLHFVGLKWQRSSPRTRCAAWARTPNAPPGR